jgi:hypothetical protein
LHRHDPALLCFKQALLHLDLCGIGQLWLADTPGLVKLDLESWHTCADTWCADGDTVELRLQAIYAPVDAPQGCLFTKDKRLSTREKTLCGLFTPQSSGGSEPTPAKDLLARLQSESGGCTRTRPDRSTRSEYTSTSDKTSADFNDSTWHPALALKDELDGWVHQILVEGGERGQEITL